MDGRPRTGSAERWAVSCGPAPGAVPAKTVHTSQHHPVKPSKKQISKSCWKQSQRHATDLDTEEQELKTVPTECRLPALTQSLARTECWVCEEKRRRKGGERRAQKEHTLRPPSVVGTESQGNHATVVAPAQPLPAGW